MEQWRDVALADHHAAEHHELPPRRPDAREIGAELAAIEGHGGERSAADCGAGKIAVVGMHRRRHEAQAGPALEIIEDDRPDPKKCVQAFVIGVLAEHGSEIGSGGLDGVGNARFTALPAAGNPDRTEKARKAFLDIRSDFSDSNKNINSLMYWKGSQI